jgi:hypothetical protein
MMHGLKHMDNFTNAVQRQSIVYILIKLRILAGEEGKGKKEREREGGTYQEAD